LLYGVDARDAETFVTTAILLVAIGFVACAIPAMKAALVDPVVALRAD
jgi:ABC-type lipoprotein release transport system permease subunit